MPGIFEQWRQPKSSDVGEAFFPLAVLFRGENHQHPARFFDLIVQAWTELLAKGLKSHLLFRDDLPDLLDLVIG